MGRYGIFLNFQTKLHFFVKLLFAGLHEIDLTITLYRETKGDIRVLYKGATNVKSVRK